MAPTQMMARGLARPDSLMRALVSHWLRDSRGRTLGTRHLSDGRGRALLENHPTCPDGRRWLVDQRPHVRASAPRIKGPKDLLMLLHHLADRWVNAWPPV